MTKIPVFFIFLIQFQFCPSQDTLKFIKLSKGKSVDVIPFFAEIDISNEKTFLHLDSMKRTISGNFLYITNDSIAIKPAWVRDIKFYDHSGQFDINEWYKYKNFCANQDTAIKVRLKEINSMARTRKKVPKVFRYALFASTASALIIAPLISIEKDGFNKARFKTVSLTSGGLALTFFVCLSLSFQKEYLITPTKHKQKTWKIIY